MTDFFSTKITYILEDLKSKNFNFYEVLTQVKEMFQDETLSLWNTIDRLMVFIKIISPDFKLIQNFYEMGKIKSHEIDAVEKKTRDMVKNSLNALIHNFENTKNQYKKFQNTISIRNVEEFIPYNEKKSSRIDNVAIEFNTITITAKEVLSLLKLFFVDELAFASSIDLKVNVLYKTDNKFSNLLDVKLEKEDILNITDFLSLEDKETILELFGHPIYQRIFNLHIFPKNFQSHAELTLDILQENQRPQKRRIVSVNGAKMNFYEVITERTPLCKFTEIIDQNNIGGFYCSVKSMNDDILYLLIDIDVPSILYYLFSPHEIWELTLNITKAIIKTAASFHLPYPKVTFSGSKGMHLLWGVEPHAVEDMENCVNIPELAYHFLPGRKQLKKDEEGILRDKFKFVKLLIQSLLLHTIYTEHIEIPSEIRQKLNIYHPYQLFKLSVDDKDLFSVLLDTSSMGRGVFRIYSPHPSTKLFSIPIFDISTGKFCEEYLDYDILIEDAKLESVIKRFKQGDCRLFLQEPNQISRGRIRSLLLPHTLFPAFATLLRFGTIDAIKRSRESYEFWHRFYQLRSFYTYIKYVVFNYDEAKNNLEGLLSYIEHLASRLSIEEKDRLLSVLNSYFYVKTVSYPHLKDKLENLYYIEFFFSIKSKIFFSHNKDNLKELFKDELEFDYFLNETTKIFSIIVDLIYYEIFEQQHITISQEQFLAFLKLSKNTDYIVNLVNFYLRELRINKKMENKENILVKTIHIIHTLYFSSIEFLIQFYKARISKEG